MSAYRSISPEVWRSRVHPLTKVGSPHHGAVTAVFLFGIVDAANHETLLPNLPQNPQQDVFREGLDLGHQLPLDIPPDLLGDVFEKDLHHVMLHPHHQDLREVAIAIDEDQIHQRADPQQEMVDLHRGVSVLLPGEGDHYRGTF
ncbi:hypothetical protein ANCCAN_11289 [Ancylostoma caninum]|uniref:Uncharacterized protein n=1 Tax=Ancylostoma caninum TaxID=29170 RepID=A0A368GEE4_ANCCA|nr:hypothetical protein ANCCAN_11289 [Ancylostoma caninum]